MKKQYLDSGKIVGTHGIKGEVRIDPWCDSPEFLCMFKKLYLDEKGETFIEVKSRPHKNITLAKIKGIFKRRFAEDKITEGDITLNLVTQTVTKNDKVLDMTAKEFELLKMLIENKGQTLTKDNLFNSIWGIDSESETQTLTVHMKWLREKIEVDPKNPAHILTVWGKGYRWEE